VSISSLKCWHFLVQVFKWIKTKIKSQISETCNNNKQVELGPSSQCRIPWIWLVFFKHFNFLFYSIILFSVYFFLNSRWSFVLTKQYSKYVCIVYIRMSWFFLWELQYKIFFRIEIKIIAFLIYILIHRPVRRTSVINWLNSIVCLKID